MAPYIVNTRVQVGTYYTHSGGGRDTGERDTREGEGLTRGRGRGRRVATG